MDIQEMTDGLSALGFAGGYALAGDPAEIILWENTEKQPSAARIKGAADQGKADREKVAAQEARRQAYIRISDPINMMWQRGLKTKQEWLDAVAQVEKDYPIPGEDAV